VAEVAFDEPFGPGGAAQRGVGGVDAGDAGDQPVGLRKIETRIEAEGHDAGGGAGVAHAGDDADDGAVGVGAGVVVGLGKREDAVEFLAFDPVLEFTGRVAGVGADFEHRDDDDFDFERRLGGEEGGERRGDGG
jgi:hypothetical protein